jgi:hypothetical protein
MPLRCHASPCREPAHIIGAFECPFCREHFEALTPLKQAEVLEIRNFSVLDVRARSRAVCIINEARRYLLNFKTQKRSA